MELIEIFILFLIGAISGYIIEIIYRNVFSKQKINPGFLKGPYLPIWGIAIIVLFLIAEQQIDIVYKIILLITIPTIFELVTGLVFTEFFKIKLWDYKENSLNFRGIICPLYSFFWAALAIIYFFFLHTKTKDYFIKILSNKSYIFFYGIIAGIFIIDGFYSWNIAFKIRKIRAKIKKKYINFAEFQEISDVFKNIKIKIEERISKKKVAR